MVELSYRNKKLEKEAENIDELRRAYGKLVPPNLIVRRLNQISASQSIQDLWQLKQLHFHALEGRYKGYFAIDIKPRGKYRMIFRPLNGKREDLRTITQVEITELCSNYH